MNLPKSERLRRHEIHTMIAPLLSQTNQALMHECMRNNSALDAALQIAMILQSSTQLWCQFSWRRTQRQWCTLEGNGSPPINCPEVITSRKGYESNYWSALALAKLAGVWAVWQLPLHNRTRLYETSGGGPSTFGSDSWELKLLQKPSKKKT
jgi:hypothetical protein